MERRLVCPLYIISHQCTSTGYGPEVTDSFCDPRGPTAPTSREQCGLFFDRGRAMFEDSVGVFICPSTSRGTSSSYRWVCGGFKASLGAKAPTEFCCMRVPAPTSTFSPTIACTDAVGVGVATCWGNEVFFSALFLRFIFSW